MRIIVTGVAEFIGSFTSTALLKLGHKITGIDNLNNYYEVQLKKRSIKLYQR
jgi:UDP-glucuronate 4-epimerase